MHDGKGYLSAESGRSSNVLGMMERSHSPFNSYRVSDAEALSR